MANPIWTLNGNGNYLVVNTTVSKNNGIIVFNIPFSEVMEGKIIIFSSSIHISGIFLVSLFDVFNSFSTEAPFFETYGYQDGYQEGLRSYGTLSLPLPSGQYIGQVTNLDPINDIVINVQAYTLSWN